MPASPLHAPLAWLRDTVTGAFEARTFLNGARIVLLAAVPFLVGITVHSPQAGLFGALGAIFIGFCDLPGSYRRRAAGLAATAALLACSAVIGTALQFIHPWGLLPLFLLGTLLAFAGTLTANAGKASTFALVVLILGGGIAGGWADVAERGLAILAGGAWMIFGTLVAWPLQPFAPARKAVQRGFAEVAKVLEVAVAGLGVPRADAILQAQTGWQARAAAFQALDAAMEILTDLRAGRDGTSMTGRRMVLAIQQGRLVAMSVGGLSQTLELAAPEARPLLDPVVAEILRGFARDAESLTAAIGPNGASRKPPPPSLQPAQISTRLGDLRTRLAERGVDAGADLDGIGFALLNIRAEIERAREALTGSIEAPAPDPGGEPRPLPLLQALLGADPAHVLADNLSLRSLRLRHGLRIGVILALTSFAYWFLEIPHGYWVSLMAVVVLKPGYGGTRAAGIARIVGTLLGGLIAAVLLHLFHGTLAHALFAAGFAVCAFGVIFRSLGLGTVLITPFVVMLFAIMSPDSSEAIWLVRIGDTVIGAALAFIAMLTLWPSTERDRLPGLAAATLERLADLQRLLLRRALGEPVAVREIRRHRRAVSLAMTELDACWEQLLGEPRSWHPRRERFYTLVSLVRLGIVQTGPLFTSPLRPLPPSAEAGARALSGAIGGVLAEVAGGLRGQAPLPDPAARTKELRQLVQALELEAESGRDAAAGTALHLIAGALSRLAATAVNTAQLAGRLRAEAEEPGEPVPRYSAPVSTAVSAPISTPGAG